MGFRELFDRGRDHSLLAPAGIPRGAPNSQEARVWIVILTHDKWDQTEQCLASLSKLDFSSMRIVIVDNGSSVPCPARILADNSTELLVNRQNLGYAQGCNCGVRHAQKRNPDYIWLLNNDTVVQPGSLTALVELGDSDPRLGAVGSILLEAGLGQKVQAWGGGRISFLTGLPSALRKSHPGMDYVCGASLLVRCSDLNQVGLMDPAFFLYWEDTDLCFRLRAHGWKLGAASKSIVVHKGSGSAMFQSAFYDYHFTASSIRFFRLHRRCWALPVLVSVTGRMTRRLLRGNWENAAAVWKAFREACASSVSAHLQPGIQQ